MTVFTPDEVANLDRYQRGDGPYQMHPFTCPHRGDGNHRENSVDLGALVPTVRGWICPYCDYTQNWAHDFMKTYPKLPDEGEPRDLYDVARQVSHGFGFDWTDPRTGELHKAPLPTPHCCPQFNGAAYDKAGVRTCRYCHQPVMAHDL
jgi:hypothetical protein